MKHHFLVAGFFLSVAFTACKSSSSEEAKPADVQAAPIPATQTPQPGTTEPATTAPAATTTTPAANNTPTVMPPTAQPVTNTAAAGLNPKHGMPGHRCDIPEGAPLNSQPSSNIVSPQQGTQNAVNVTKAQSVSIPAPTQVTTKPANTAPVATGAGLNPEHGKPGHRCDIAVGAPLSSAPAPK